MPGFTLSTRFDAPVEAVFAVCTDFERAADRIPAIKRVEMLTAGPVGPGTRFKETRIVFRREATETFEVTAFEPNRRYELTAASCGARYRFEFRFAPDGAGTRVDVGTEITAESFWAKLFSPLAKLMMGTMKKCVSDDLDALRAAVEPRKQAA